MRPKIDEKWIATLWGNEDSVLILDEDESGYALRSLINNLYIYIPTEDIEFLEKVQDAYT